MKHDLTSGGVKMGRIDNKVAVITGAASGMGRATAIRFATEGASVVIVDLNSNGGEEVASECRQVGGRAVFQKADVSNEEQVKAAINRAVQEFGRLDITFNNAGLSGAVGPIDEISVEDWDRTLAILLRSVFLGMKHSIPVMRKTGGGVILSTSSLGGLRGVAELHAYSAAKAGVVSLTESVASLVGGDNIRVNCICPGPINTPLAHKTMIGGRAAAEEALKNMQPIRRAGSGEDVASMALFLASDEAAWITGTSMIVDGGGYASGGRAGGSLGMKPGYLGPSFTL
jgi:NAD(P)-dependent dehydrogenase (short-subunit alcohol dehydrogenase family)